MKILSKIKVCSGVGRHAWYETNLDFPVRKPIISSIKPTPDSAPLYSGIAYQPSIIHLGGYIWGFRSLFKWLNRFLDWLWLKFR